MIAGYPKLDTFLKREKALSALHALLSLLHPLGQVLLSDKRSEVPGQLDPKWHHVSFVTRHPC